MSQISSILIVDDSETARMIIRKCLEIIGFQGVKYNEADNGREALNIMKKTDVNLIFTDFNMPVMDGGVFLKWVKGSHKFKDTPVVVITSAGNPAREQQLKQDGAFAVIKKPVSPAILSGELSDLIDN